MKLFFRNINVVDIGPEIPTNFPGEDRSDTATYRVDITNIYYQLVIPALWITPRDVVVAVGSTNAIRFTVTGTNLTNGVTWVIEPDLSGSGGATMQSNNWYSRDVYPGYVATNYKVRATSVDNSNFYDEVDLKVLNVDVEQVEANVSWTTTNMSLNLTADSFLGGGTADWTSEPSGISGSGTNVTFNPSGLTPTTYIVRAQSSLLTNCFDTCTVTVVKVEVEKCSSNFLPQGGSNNNTTTIRVFVTPSTAKGKFKFTLYDVSDEKGYCLNAPTNLPTSGEDSDSWKDFQFPSQAGFEISGTDSNIAETVASDFNEATVTIKSFDYGSFGKIKVEFTNQDYSFTCITIEVGGTNEYTRLPADTNDNCIADSWSGDTGPTGSYLATDDNETTPAGANNGDGLTRYEEYRGFIVNGVHLRTSTLNKDLFVRDENTIGLGNAGMLGFELHSIGNDEWSGPTTRKINSNGNNNQCAIRLEDLGANGQGLLGLCYLGTPNGGDHARVYVQEILNLGGNQANVDKTIAHEIGHDVNITGDHDSPPECMMNQGLLVRTNYCSECLSQRQLH
jgi:hypothetical protein